MGKHDDKTARAAHIKRHTVGTSNEISFSVLDAAKNALDDASARGEAKGGLPFGKISLFTLSRKKKTISTPVRESGLPLSTGDFVSTDSVDIPAGVPATTPVSSSLSASGGASVPANAVAGTLPVSAGGTVPWPPPAEEVARRKSTRKRRRFVAHALIAGVAVVLVGFFCLWLYQTHETQQAHIAKLDSGLEYVEQADGPVNAFNEALSRLFALPEGSVADESLSQALLSCEEALASAQDDLSQAEVLVREALDGLPDSVDREAANQASVAIEARRAMIAAGSLLADDAAAASNAGAIVSLAWEATLEADALARDAALLVTETTDENVTASMEKTQQALDLFQKASDDFANAVSMYAGADFSACQDYLAKRIEAMGYALAANEAFLARNKEEMLAQNDAYNEADAAAATLAASLPEDPVFIVAEASATAMADVENDYVSACSRAAAADAFLRDYLGMSGE